MLPGGVSRHQVVLPVMQPTESAAGYSKTSVSIYWITWHHGFKLNTHWYENLKHQLTFSLLFFLLDDFFFGDFLKLDLKLPLRGSFTIHEGGTMIPLCVPAMAIH